MEGPVLVQDWVTITGDRKAQEPYEVYPHRDAWLWVGNAQAVVLTVEVKTVSGADPLPSLNIETAASETGPWKVLATYQAPTLDPPADMLHLRRDPNAAENRRVAGFLRWSVTQPEDIATAEYDWGICFRIVAVLEGIS